MDAATLVDAMLGSNRLSMKRAKELLPGLLDAFELANLKSVNRRAMFLAQCGEESGSLRFTEEIADGSEYEGRADLGNTQPGDGKRFKGRTFIQITGRHNYTKLSEWAHKHGVVPTPTFFVDNPKALAADKHVWLGPVWYWTVARPGLNGMADRGDVVGATQAINGGQHGFDDRLMRWKHCLKLGSRLMGEDELVMDAEVKAAFDQLNERLDRLENRFLGSDGHPQSVERAVAHVTKNVPYASGKGKDYSKLP